MKDRVIVFCMVVALFAVFSFTYTAFANVASKETIEKLCKDDYVKYCSDFEPYTKEGDQCVEDNLDNLKEECRTALVKRETHKRIVDRVFNELRRWGIDIRGH